MNVAKIRDRGVVAKQETARFVLSVVTIEVAVDCTIRPRINNVTVICIIFNFHWCWWLWFIIRFKAGKRNSSNSSIRGSYHVIFISSNIEVQETSWVNSNVFYDAKGMLQGAGNLRKSWIIGTGTANQKVEYWCTFLGGSAYTRGRGSTALPLGTALPLWQRCYRRISTVLPLVNTLESMDLPDTPCRSFPVERYISTDRTIIVCL